MDILRDEFKKIELECMCKQRNLILEYIQKNESDRKELQIYLDKITINIKRLEKKYED